MRCQTLCVVYTGEHRNRLRCAQEAEWECR